MPTYHITYKMFEVGKDYNWANYPEDQEMDIQANSEREAINKAQKAIGLYVMECELKEQDSGGPTEPLPDPGDNA